MINEYIPIEPFKKFAEVIVIKLENESTEPIFISPDERIGAVDRYVEYLTLMRQVHKRVKRDKIEEEKENLRKAQEIEKEIKELKTNRPSKDSKSLPRQNKLF